MAQAFCPVQDKNLALMGRQSAHRKIDPDGLVRREPIGFIALQQIAAHETNRGSRSADLAQTISPGRPVTLNAS